MKHIAVLFDIDGTLLNCNSAGKHSLIQATMEVFGSIGRMERIDFQGKTDPLILHESLVMMGFDEKLIADKTDVLKERYFSYLAQNILLYDPVIMPGIQEILTALSQNSRVLLGLLTGNFKRSAEIKLSSHDLNKFFKFGVFGDDASARNDMPAIAKVRIKEKFDLDIEYASMAIIGDTEHDINCARHSGAVAISVGTGWTDKETLRNLNPDYYFENLSDIELVSSTLLSL